MEDKTYLKLLVADAVDKGVRTLGFALAKGLIRGLTRRQPVLEILTYYPFLDVS